MCLAILLLCDDRYYTLQAKNVTLTRVQDEINKRVFVSLYVWVQVRFAGDVAFAMQLWARNLRHHVCVCSVLCVTVMFCLCHHACTCVEMPLLSLAFAKQSCCSYVLICSATAMCAYIYIYIYVYIDGHVYICICIEGERESDTQNEEMHVHPHM